MYVCVYVYAHIYHIDIYVNYIYIGGIWGLFSYTRTPTLIIAWWVGERQAFGLRKIVGSTYFPYGNGRDWFGTQGQKIGNDMWTILAACESGALLNLDPQISRCWFTDLSGGVGLLIRAFGNSDHPAFVRFFVGDLDYMHGRRTPEVSRVLWCVLFGRKAWQFLGHLSNEKKFGCLVYIYIYIWMYIRKKSPSFIVF